MANTNSPRICWIEMVIDPGQPGFLHGDGQSSVAINVSFTPRDSFGKQCRIWHRKWVELLAFIEKESPGSQVVDADISPWQYI